MQELSEQGVMFVNIYRRYRLLFCNQTSPVSEKNMPYASFYVYMIRIQVMVKSDWPF